MSGFQPFHLPHLNANNSANMNNFKHPTDSNNVTVPITAIRLDEPSSSSSVYGLQRGPSAVMPATSTTESRRRRKRKSKSVRNTMKRRTWFANKISEKRNRVRFKKNSTIIPNYYPESMDTTENISSEFPASENPNLSPENNLPRSAEEVTNDSLFLKAVENLKLDEFSSVSSENEIQSLPKSDVPSADPLYFISDDMNFDFGTSTIWIPSSAPPFSCPKSTSEGSPSSENDPATTSTGATNWTFSCSFPSGPLSEHCAREESVDSTGGEPGFPSPVTIPVINPTYPGKMPRKKYLKLQQQLLKDDKMAKEKKTKRKDRVTDCSRPTENPSAAEAVESKRKREKNTEKKRKTNSKKQDDGHVNDEWIFDPDERGDLGLILNVNLSNLSYENGKLMVNVQTEIGNFWVPHEWAKSLKLEKHLKAKLTRFYNKFLKSNGSISC